jgi:two-component system chemotaxis response regulator CheB
VKKIRVLIVDDSAVIRKIIAQGLKSESQIEVVGYAENGKKALEAIELLAPDAITLDVEMPEMDGITTLKEIRKRDQHIPIVMFSSLTSEGGDDAIRALTAGASDCVGKPDYSTGSIEGAYKAIEEQLIPKILALAMQSRTRKKITQQISDQKITTQINLADSRLKLKSVNKEAGFADALCIGSSTGGPMALMELFSQLKQPLNIPVFIVQHMPENFTGLLASRLTATGGMTIKEGGDNEIALSGIAYIAPGGFHMTLSKKGNQILINLNKDAPENNCRPAVDVLFRSAAKVYGQNLLAVVLTGMGSDGLKGSREIAASGGLIYAQDEKSSVVWGMPGAVASEGLASKVVGIHEIAAHIIYSVKAF